MLARVDDATLRRLIGAILLSLLVLQLVVHTRQPAAVGARADVLVAPGRGGRRADRRLHHHGRQRRRDR